MNYVLYYKIPYYTGISFELLSMYIIWIFTDCPLCTDLISLYKLDILFMYCIYKIISIGILLSRLILCCAYCYANDKLYIYFDGSLECLINKQINLHSCKISEN
jgi:hypothetical protein